jgi:hypothetical protein
MKQYPWGLHLTREVTQSAHSDFDQTFIINTWLIMIFGTNLFSCDEDPDL